MVRMLIPWLSDDDGPSMWRDLRGGEAGWLLRAGLSIAAAAGCIAIVMLAFGAIESGGRGRHLRDEHVAVGVFFMFGAWLFSLAWIWMGYRRWRATLLTIFSVLAIVALTVVTCVLIESTIRRSEFFIAATILTGGGSIIVVLCRAFHRAGRGSPVQDPSGSVRVNCPACGYSMVGLDTCQCPECGARTTIDALIEAQQYGRTRPEPARSTTMGPLDPVAE